MEDPSSVASLANGTEGCERGVFGPHFLGRDVERLEVEAQQPRCCSIRHSIILFLLRLLNMHLAWSESQDLRLLEDFIFNCLSPSLNLIALPPEVPGLKLCRHEPLKTNPLNP
jgi:hypothetical protein